MATRTTNGTGAANALTPAAIQEMKRLGVEYSEDAEERHLKLLFWGATSTRKTETVLRNFPNVLLIDTEGNSDMCVGMKVIPPFQRVKTQDSRKVLAVLEAAGKGLIRMPNGEPIQTVCIDSISVLWGVQQEVAASLAEQRAQKRNNAIDDANITQNDWTKAKRPLKHVLNRFSKGLIPILVLIAREKDLVKELPDGTMQKLGLTPDAVKNTDYDMNLALHFMWESPEKRKWSYQVSKVQGILGETFPDGSTGTVIPFDKIWEYTSHLKPVIEEDNGEGDNLPDRIASSIVQEVEQKTQSNLIAFATANGFDAKALGAILKEAGFKGFDPSRWEDMKKAVVEATNGINQSANLQ